MSTLVRIVVLPVNQKQVLHAYRKSQYQITTANKLAVCVKVSLKCYKYNNYAQTTLYYVLDLREKRILPGPAEEETMLALAGIGIQFSPRTRLVDYYTLIGETLVVVVVWVRG